MYADDRSGTAALTVDSKVTTRSQTTIPAPVREALKIQPGKDHLQYQILPGGRVLLSRREETPEDDVMEAFLQFLAADIKNAPQNIQPFDMSRGRELISGVDVNLDDEIRDED
ncbi:HtrA suppressor protein SohA [Cedecea davisae]|uniref:Toxin-antitoxin system, antitoxin component, AbrB family n=1 Tax=Cedecea davisae DSM 4568 TaxID=566551 RepID=S3J1H8_9ENTR|nr:type II toxin-antitoxin system PrlF family antitoxin [Cedecea davisae]EPF18586.1 toxin-antitoxin system, antitoxin component, AbrB family [Cedecea davisae DSM 4568]SUX28594.1 HtrA suppressor protein SohA [Cedecea davisae]